MPIYVFRCEDCGEKFDRLQKLSDSDPDTCPNCGKHDVRRQVTAPAFRLAGSGWYETDFKSDKETRHNLASRDEPPPKPAAEGGKSAEKPAGGDKASAGAAGASDGGNGKRPGPAASHRTASAPED